MMLTLAIDPGPVKSSYVAMYGAMIIEKGTCSNDQIIDIITRGFGSSWTLCVEMIASYGMPVGAEVFETCVWIGRFIQAWPHQRRLVYRKDVKMALCGSMKAKDSNIRQSLIDVFGPGKQKAIGTKRSPGLLYGVSKDMWAALAVAVYVQGRDELSKMLQNKRDESRAKQKRK